MARVKMVTRTVTGATVKVLLINVETKEVAEDIAFLPGGIRKTPEKTQVALEALYAGTGYKVVMDRVLDASAGKRYGMPETDFLRYATVLSDDSADEAAADNTSEGGAN